jgi:hypothetical protein
MDALQMPQKDALQNTCRVISNAVILFKEGIWKGETAEAVAEVKNWLTGMLTSAQKTLEGMNEPKAEPTTEVTHTTGEGTNSPRNRKKGKQLRPTENHA